MVLSCCAERGVLSPPGILGRGGRDLSLLKRFGGNSGRNYSKMRGQLLAHSILFLRMDQKTLRGNSYFVNNYNLKLIFFSGKNEKKKLRNWNFRIPLLCTLQPGGANLRTSFLTEIIAEKYIRSTTLGCKDIRISKSEFVTKTFFPPILPVSFGFDDVKWTKISDWILSARNLGRLDWSRSQCVQEIELTPFKFHEYLLSIL